jgi:hypothetical protein
LAWAVKIADLMHNSELFRIPNPTQTGFDRVGQYQREIEILNKMED